MQTNPEIKYRTAALNWLHEQVQYHGEVLPRRLLEDGFYADGVRITLIGPQGIWKPKVFAEVPISITSIVDGPYDDSITHDNYLLYKYRGNNPDHRDNRGLRKAMTDATPLVYFHRVAKGQYLATWPVYIVGDNPGALTFTVAVDDQQYMNFNQKNEILTVKDSYADTVRRSYISSTVRVRVHQSTFRERVLQAYSEQCALCRLRHRELLDAAHIIPDSDPAGEPVITNGLSLCKLHHAAYDNNIIGITPDYIIKIRNDILEEKDGPMLAHGLQGLHDHSIILPKDQSHYPNQDFLDRRYSMFKENI